MTLNGDLRLAELLTSKLCHDLVGPVGAVNNGMELLAEQDLLMGDEAVQLATHSAQHAATLLQFYRLAYGASGGAITDYGVVRDLCEKMLRHQKSTLVWPQKLPAMLPSATPKLLMNLCQLAAESLPRGGEVTLSLAEAGGQLEIAFTARGRDARLRPENEVGLDEHADLSDISPRSVHAYLTRRLVLRESGAFSIAPGQDEIRIAAAIPA